MREPENGDWLRRVMDIAVVMGGADGACPLFRAASLGHMEKGDWLRAGEISGGFSIYSCSEPVPLFHSTQPTLHFSWAVRRPN